MCKDHLASRGGTNEDIRIALLPTSNWKLKRVARKLRQSTGDSALDEALELLLYQITGSPAHGREVVGILLIHVDDSFFTGTPELMTYLVKETGKEYKIGSEDWNDVMFCGQRSKLLFNERLEKDHIDVDQERGIDDLAEVIYDKNLDPDLACDADLHHQFRSGEGAVNWLQSRTQYQACYPFSRCASALAAPTTKDLEKLNKLIRQIRTDAVTLNIWPLPSFSLRLIWVS